VIGNGDAFLIEDYEKFKKETKCSSVMFARGAMWNCSIFSDSEKLEDKNVVAQKYILNCLKLDNNFQNSSNFIS
jgi:tRNA-dihydrouridine synthase